MNGHRHRLKLAAAFAAVYIIWGSNFLAIRYATEAMPPFLMMAVRSMLAGSLLVAWARVREGVRPSRAHWGPAAAVGTLLFLGCHGLLAWAEQTVPSGLASLPMATTPVWLALLDWAAGGARPRGQTVFGMALGLGGLAILIAPGHAQGAPLLGLLALVLGAFAWAAGSVLSGRVPRSESLVLASGMQLLTGGAVLAIVGLALGEAGRVDAGVLAPRPLLGFAFMVVASSLLGFTAYMWLLRVTTPARAGTYAFVNPVVALFVGSFIGGETLEARTLWASLVIVAGVAIIVAARDGGGKGDVHDRATVEGNDPGGSGGRVSPVPEAHGRVALPGHAR